MSICIRLAVTRQVFQHQELPCNYRIIQRRRLLADAGRDSLYNSVFVQVVKKGNGQPTTPILFFASWGIDDPMKSGTPAIIGPSAHKITKVDNKAIFHKRNIMPYWLIF